MYLFCIFKNNLFSQIPAKGKIDQLFQILFGQLGTKKLSKMKKIKVVLNWPKWGDNWSEIIGQKSLLIS